MTKKINKKTKKIDRYYKDIQTLKGLYEKLNAAYKKIWSLESYHGKIKGQKQRLENRLNKIKDLVYCKKCDKVYLMDNLESEKYIEVSSETAGHGGYGDSHVIYGAWHVYKCKKCNSPLAKKHANTSTQEELKRKWEIQYALIQHTLITKDYDTSYDLSGLKNLD